MDRTRTIFLNIVRRKDVWSKTSIEMEMHNIKSILRDGDQEQTYIITEEGWNICIPMNEKDHYKFMQSVFSSREMWFSYAGYIEAILEDGTYNIRCENENKYHKQDAQDFNESTTFSVSTSALNNN